MSWPRNELADAFDELKEDEGLNAGGANGVIDLTKDKEDALEHKLQQLVKKAGQWPIGDSLRALRAEQEQKGNREYYGVEHLRRLLLFESEHAYSGGGRAKRCSDVHRLDCKECTSCHFCRQKTIDVKTRCRCANERGFLEGGPRRGIWCGSCLSARMGENIHEVLKRDDWRCPACRRICNCSGANCQRKSANLCDTGPLAHEAHTLKYKSVAHYLILTHLDTTGTLAAAAPMTRLDVAGSDRRQQQRNKSTAGAAGQLQDQLPNIPGAGATVNALREESRRRQKAMQQQTAQMMQACKAVFAVPLEDGAAAPPTADRAIGFDMLDDEQLAAEDDLADEEPSLILGPPQVPLGSALQTMQRHGPRMRTNDGGSGSAGNTCSRSAAPAGTATCTAAAGLGPLDIPAQPSGGDHTASDGFLSPDRIISPTAAVFSTAAEPEQVNLLPLGPPGAQQECLGMGVLGIQSFNVDVLMDLPERGRSPVDRGFSPVDRGFSPVERQQQHRQQQQHSTAAGGVEAAADHGAGAKTDRMARVAAAGGGVGTAAAGRMQQQKQQHQAAQSGMQTHQQRQPLQPLPQQNINRQGQQQQSEKQQQQQGKQSLQVDESYGPNDLPGCEAPGYRAAEAAAGATRVRQHQHWHSQSQRLGGSSNRQPGMSTWFSRTNRPASGKASLGQIGSSRRAGGLAATGGKAVESLHASRTAAGDADGPPTKRARLSAEAPDAEIRAAAAVNEPMQQSEQQRPAQASALQQQPGLGPMPQPLQQQQQRQHSAVYHNPPAQRSATASWDAVELFPSRLSEHLKALQVTKRLLRLQQSGRLQAAGNSSSSSQNLAMKHLSDIWNAAFADSSQWDNPMVVNHAFGASVGSLSEFKTAADMLIELSGLMPLDFVSFDVMRRLKGLDPFLDFKQSDPPARFVLLNALCRVMEALILRSDPEHVVAATEAAINLHLPALTAGNGLAAEAALAAVQNAAESALADMGHAEAGMLEVVDALLDVIQILDEEFRTIRSWLTSPKDLLGPIRLGPISWPSAYNSSTCLPGQPSAPSDLASARHFKQLQEEHQQLEREHRMPQLEALAELDEKAVQNIMKQLCALLRAPETAHLVTRRVAAELLARPELGQLLDIQVEWPPQARISMLEAVTALIHQAAPDLQQHELWPVQDAQQLQQLLSQQQQQYAATTQQLPPLEAAHQLLMQLQDALETQMAMAGRVAHVQGVELLVRKHMLLHIEQLVAAQFSPRHNWVQDKFGLNKQTAVQQSMQQQQQQQSWFGAAVAPGAVAAAAKAAVQQQLTVQQQEWRLGHTQQLKHRNVAALVAVYSLQMQAGTVTWSAMEKNIVAPATSLNHFGEFYRNPVLRHMVLGMTGMLLVQVPSLLRWQQQIQQQGAVMPGAAGQQTTAGPAAAPCMPAEWMLRLWIRAVFDVPSELQRHRVVHASFALANNSATAALFPSRWLAQAKDQLLKDRSGQWRGHLAVQVVRAVAGGAGAAGTSGFGRLSEVRDVLGGFCQVMRSRQAELEAHPNASAVLQWQRGCMAGLLGLAEVVAGALRNCNAFANRSAANGTGAYQLPRHPQQRKSFGEGYGGAGSTAPPWQVLNDLRDTIKQMTGLASTWVRAGISAVCSVRDGSSTVSGSGKVANGEGGPSTSGSDMLGEAAELTAEAMQILQGSALVHASRYLAVLIALAGHGCWIDGISTANWPANCSTNSRKLAQAWNAAPPHQQHQQAVLSLPGLSELMTTLLTALSARDQLYPSEQLLLNFLTRTLVHFSGMSSTDSAAVSAGTAAAGSQESRSAPVPEGYSSPGLLHVLLGTHLRLVLEASCDKGTPVIHTRAINAMHFITALLNQPGLQQPQHLQLLLPCLARPLAKQLTASSGCPAVQRLVLFLLGKLFAGPCGQQLGQAAANAAVTGTLAFGTGPLRTMSPVTADQLQQLLSALLKTSLQACLSLVVSETGVNTASVQAAVNRKAQLALGADAVAAGNAAAGSLYAQLVAPVQPSDVGQALQQLLSITGPPAEVPPELNTWLSALNSTAARAAAANTSAALMYPSGAGALAAAQQKAVVMYSRPGDYGLIVARFALLCCRNLARLGGFLQQQVLHAMPWMYEVMLKSGLRGKPLVQKYNELVKDLPQQWQQQFKLPDLVSMPPPTRTPQQQQQQKAVPGQPPPRPTVQQQQQRQQQQYKQVQAASACGSQACNREQQQQRSTDGADQQQQKRMRIEAPVASQVFSQDGGRAASCTVVMQQSQVHSQTDKQPTQHTHGLPQQQQQQQRIAAEIADGAGRNREDHDAAGAATADDDNDEISSAVSSGKSRQVQRSSTGQELACNAEVQHPQQHEPSVGQQQQELNQAQQQKQQASVVQAGQQQHARMQAQQQQDADTVQLFGEVAKCRPLNTATLGYELVLVVYEAGKQYRPLLLLKSHVASRARELLEAGRLKKGILAGVSDVSRIPEGQVKHKNPFMTTKGSRLYCASSSQQQPAPGTQAASSSGGGNGTGRQHNNSSNSTGDRATTQTGGGSTGNGTASGCGADVAAADEMSAWWQDQHERHTYMKNQYVRKQRRLEQQKLRTQAQEQTQQPGEQQQQQQQQQRVTSQMEQQHAATHAAVRRGGAVGTAVQQAASFIDDSQATVKYMTLPSQREQ